MPDAPTEMQRLEQLRASLTAKEEDLRMVMITVNSAFRILNARALVMLTGAVAAGLFGWAVNEPTVGRTAAACAFSLLVFLPALWVDARRV